MSTRTVTLYSTKGGKQKVETDAKTWGELKPLVEEHYDLKNLQPTENVNKTTLTHQDAVLPEGDFIIFLRPVKPKGGMDGVEGLSFRELRKLVTNDDIKSHLNQYSGKNWTRLSTEELRAGLAAYFKEYHSNEASSTEQETVNEASSDEQETVNEDVKMILTEKASAVKQHLEEMDEVTTDIREKILIALCKNLIQALIGKYSKSEDTTEEEDSLKEEYEDFIKGFDN